MFASNACLYYFVLSNRVFSKKLVLHENQNAIKIAEKLDVKKYIVTNKSRYIHARAKNNMKTALFARNSTSQWKRVWFFHRRHGRRVLVSGKVRYGFLLDVWWPDLYDCLSLDVVNTLAKSIGSDNFIQTSLTSISLLLLWTMTYFFIYNLIIYLILFNWLLMYLTIC